MTVWSRGGRILLARLAGVPMFLREWFRPPRHLLALFVAVIALPAMALAWLAWRTFEQDKALERQRLQERLETAATTIVTGLSVRLDELSRQVPLLAAARAAATDIS